MKKLALVLSLVLMLTFVGCSSKTTVKETDAFRFDSKTAMRIPLRRSASTRRSLNPLSALS